MQSAYKETRQKFKVIARERLFDPEQPSGLRKNIDKGFFSYVEELDDEAARTLLWVGAIEAAFESRNSLLQSILIREIEDSIWLRHNEPYAKVATSYLAQQHILQFTHGSSFKIQHTQEVIGFLKQDSATFDLPTRGIESHEYTRLRFNRERADQIHASVSQTISRWKAAANIDLSLHPDTAVFLARHHFYPGVGALPSPADVQRGRLSSAILTQIRKRIDSGQGRSGKVLELAGTLFLASLPGYLVRHNVQSAGFQIDVLARHFVGFGDFRDLHGRDLLCECKDTKKPVGLDPVAKLFALLEANDVQLGILLTKSRLTEQGEERNARDLLRRMAARTGRYVMTITLEELVHLADNNGNTVEFLREKFYEARSL